MPRPAKTDHQHQLQGTVSQVGRSKTTQAASRYAGGRPQIPQHLDRLARSEFKKVCHELEHRKTLTSGDRTTIAVLAECYSRWVTAKKELGTNYTILSHHHRQAWQRHYDCEGKPTFESGRSL